MVEKLLNFHTVEYPQSKFSIRLLRSVKVFIFDFITVKPKCVRKSLANTSDGSNTILLNIDRTWTHYFWLQTIEHRTSNLIGPSLDLLNSLTKRLEHQMNWNLIFRTLNELERVHLLVIELKHPIFGFKHSSTHYYMILLTSNISLSIMTPQMKLWFCLFCELCTLVHLHAVGIWNFSLIRSPSTTSSSLQKMGKANNVQEFIYLFKLPFHSLFYKVFKKMLTHFCKF